MTCNPDGVGEHWDVFFRGDEGCSESDWLRFNLDLWRFTGQPRYLDAAERLRRNQYAANQCPNGGYGWRSVEGDAAGPVATRGTVDEWNFCCSFHGPLGLHFLKAYDAPQFKTRPNTLRPHVRRQGQWTISDPVPLPKPVRRGETHRIAVECRARQITELSKGMKVLLGPFDAGFAVADFHQTADGASIEFVWYREEPKT